ncbi:MAG: LPS export ABC transporter periplasmic protein LptC [Gallionella sp.]|nr:LPS export ABC transporter periplasmic protein LptC [Gallionella sp.]
MSVAARARYWLLLLPLVGLLGMTYWLNMQTQNELPKAKIDTRLGIDALMENFSATKMDAQGKPHFIMSAKQLHHYPEDDSTTLDGPVLTTLSNEGIAMHATAKQGKIIGKGEEVILNDQVEMLRDASAQQDKLTLQTEYLHMLPHQNLITTDRPVMLTDAHTTVHAVGMEMDYKLRTFKLLSRVRSEYVPAKK